MFDSGTPSPNPWDLAPWGQNGWNTMEALERRIGQRRDATRAPTRGPEWQGGPGRPKDQISDSVVHNLLEPKNGLDFGVHLTPLHKLLDMKDWHHYCQAEEVATQFCTFERNGKKFKAGPNDNYSKSFSKLAVLTASDSDGGYDLHLKNIQVKASYPVAVFQGPIYQVEDENGKAKVEAVDHLQLHHSATVSGRLIQVQIDVVTEAAFPQLMDKILEELNTFRDRIGGMRPRLLNSALDQKQVASRDAARQMFSAILPGGQYR